MTNNNGTRTMEQEQSASELIEFKIITNQEVVDKEMKSDEVSKSILNRILERPGRIRQSVMEKRTNYVAQSVVRLPLEPIQLSLTNTIKANDNTNDDINDNEDYSHIETFELED